ncbi:unnamed protein product [Ambrosiozyma monospora]|uniref:Unnamed protein product n=1 Tax=Ambrosiozyma monospora TaxID=43982 RepID=A0ACB5T6N1_AMBMO|nr:unnamed protein product [Ambrosiozyma monospora]
MNTPTLSTSVLLLLITKTLADETIQLVIKSDNSDLSGKGISSIHEGAGINYMFAGNGAMDLTYASTSITTTDIGYPQYFNVDDDGGVISMSVASQSSGFTFSDDGTLQYNGSDEGFQACKNINDPYNYSSSSYAICYKEQDGDCVDIKLVKKDSSGSSSGSGSGSSSGSNSSSGAVSSSSPTTSGSVSSTTQSSEFNHKNSAFRSGQSESNTETTAASSTSGSDSNSSTITSANIRASSGSQSESASASCSKCSQLANFESSKGLAAEVARPAGFAAVIAFAGALLI